jgi:flavorubredoxin
MNKRLKKWGYIFIGVILFWMVLTIWANNSGNQHLLTVGDEGAKYSALIVYNPDPIYNLDEQVCTAFARGLKETGFYSQVASLDYEDIDTQKEYDLIVFCANTYNWAPDWKTTEFIANYPDLVNQDVVAITLGSGSTARAKRLLDEAITKRNANLIESKEFWLLKPNDEERMEESNVDVATDMAQDLGLHIGLFLTTK